MRLARILGLAGLTLIGLSLWWRWAARRRSLPCPTWFAAGLESPLMDRLMGTERTLNQMGLRPGQRVLEIGPGPGRLLLPAARRVLPGGEVAGLDVQPGMIERLNARAARAGITNLTTVIGDAAQPHFAPRSFDLVFLSTVLGEIPDQPAALGQAHTALKPEGMLSITEVFPDPHYQSPAAVRRLAEASGFRLREIHGPWYRFTANFVKA